MSSISSPDPGEHRDHTMIFQELKLIREDHTRDINAVREDLRAFLKVTREEHQGDMEEIKSWMRRVDERLGNVEKDVIHAKNDATNALSESKKNTNWQTWAARIVLGAVMLGVVGILIKGSW